MIDALVDAHTLEEVISIINHLETPGYHVDADMRSAEQLAGQYAYDAAIESGYISDRSIESRLECLYDSGASFDWDEALGEAMSIKESHRSVAVTLADYIDDEFDGYQCDFATLQGVQPPQVTQWIKKQMLVVDDCLYSFRRELIKP